MCTLQLCEALKGKFFEVTGDVNWYYSTNTISINPLISIVTRRQSSITNLKFDIHVENVIIYEHNPLQYKIKKVSGKIYKKK